MENIKMKTFIEFLNATELDETRDRAELINLMNRTGERVASDTKTDKGRVTPKTNQALRINIKARKRLGLSVESTELDELKTTTYKSYKRKAEKQEKDLFDKGYFKLSPRQKKKADDRRDGINKADELIRRRREGDHPLDAPKSGRKGRERIQEEKKKMNEDWQKVNRQDKTDGLSQKAVDAYRRENPGSKLKTAVTEKNPKGKRAGRRKSFCSRMCGMKKRLTSAETSRDPDSRINKALRRWNCNCS